MPPEFLGLVPLGYPRFNEPNIALGTETFGVEGNMTRRFGHRILLAFATAWLANCGRSAEGGNECRTDEDCPARHVCLALEYGSYCVREVDGEPGAGGQGGDGSDLYPASTTVELQLLADAELIAYLERHDRRIASIVIRHANTDGEREVLFPLAQDETFPLGPLEIRLPLKSRQEERRLEVAARGYRRDGSLAPLGEGEIVVKLFAHQRLTAVATLSLVRDFDWDLDGDPDLTDCAPADPEVHHGAYDVCDGVRQACGSSFCFLPLGEDETVADLYCRAEDRKCVVAIERPGVNTIRLYETAFPFSWRDLYNRDANAFAVVSGSEDPRYVRVGDKAIYLVEVQNDQLRDARTSSKYFRGSVAAMQNGPMTTVVAPLRDDFGVAVWERSQDYPPPSPFDFSLFPRCDAEGSECTYVLLDELLGDPSWRVGHLSIDRSEPSGILDILFTIEGDPRIGSLQVKWDGTRVASLLEPPPGAAVNRFFAPLRNAGYLFLSYFDQSSSPRATVLRRTGSFASDVFVRDVPLPPGACPSAIDPFRSAYSLWMADDCTGSLWELPLDPEGLPSLQEPVQHRLDRCAEPFVLSSLPLSEYSLAVTFVGCRGENHILVFGRL